jgi:chromosome segregation ATPase
MSENNRMEEMLSTLITLVGTIRSDQEIMREDFKELKTEINGIKGELTDIKTELSGIKTEINDMKSEIKDIHNEGEKKHKEILDKLSLIEADQDHIWDKAVRNEREIVKLKKQYEL